MRNYLLKVRVSKLEQAIIQKKAKDSGLSVSELIRGLALGYQLSAKLTPEENEGYRLLTKFSVNFIRIGNLFKLGDVDNFKKETLATAHEIREHLLKFK